MLKTALFDSAINEKCCSFDGGRGIRSFFSSHTEGFDSSRVPNPGNLPSKAKKNGNPGDQHEGGGGGGGGRGRGYAQLELTDA